MLEVQINYKNLKLILDILGQVKTWIFFIFLINQIKKDNGDAISEFYAGTGALRSYFSRTGKSSFTGLLSDGYKSTLRYYLNNLSDGSKQDSIDILLGNISIEFIKENSIYDQKLNAGFIGGILLFIFSFFKPKSISSTFHYFIAMIWLFIFIIFWMFCCIDGKKIVNKSKFVEEEDIE